MLLLLLLGYQHSNCSPTRHMQFCQQPACSDAGPGQDSKGKSVDVWTNFREYGLHSPVGLMRADSHLPPFRPGLQEVIDAIICDPPYGVGVLPVSILVVPGLCPPTCRPSIMPSVHKSMRQQVCVLMRFCCSPVPGGRQGRDMHDGLPDVWC